MLEKTWRNVETTVCQARGGETWMRWNGFLERHRLHSTEYLKHLQPRARRDKMRVWHVKEARGAVCCSHFLNHKQQQELHVAKVTFHAHQLDTNERGLY